MFMRFFAVTFATCLLPQAFAQFAPATFQARTDLPNLGQDSVVLADLNNDGILDIVAYPTVEVWLGKGDGTFNALPVQQFTDASARVDEHSQVASKNSAPLLSVADMNGDGNLDIVFNPSTNKIYVAFGNGDGTFQTALVGYKILGEPLSFVVADINRDGYPDIVAGTSSGIVEELLNDGRGSFNLHVLYKSASPVGAVAVRDVNGDGFADIVFGVDSAVTILLGTGTGAFQPGSSIPVNGIPGSLYFADFDGDGKTDLAVGGSEFVKLSGQITILHGDGKGNFGSPGIDRE